MGFIPTGTEYNKYLVYYDRTVSDIDYAGPKDCDFYYNDATGITATLPDGTNVTAHKYAILPLGGYPNYYRLYVYEDSATAP